MDLHFVTLIFNLFGKGKKMDQNTTSDVVNTVASAAQTVQDVGAAQGTAAKVETAVAEGAETLSAAFGTLKDLHLVNTALADHGTSIAEVIAAVAKAFLGIHIF